MGERSTAERMRWLVKYWSTWPWEQPSQIVYCEGYCFASVTNDGIDVFFKSPRPRPPIHLVGSWLNGRQRRWNGCPISSIESALRFDGASEITAKTKIQFNLNPMTHRIIKFVCLLIVFTLSSPSPLFIVIAKAIAADGRDASNEPPSQMATACG